MIFHFNLIKESSPQFDYNVIKHSGGRKTAISNIRKRSTVNFI